MLRARKELSRRAAEWLVRVLEPGPRTLRYLTRSHGMRRADILEAASLGIVTIEPAGRSQCVNLTANALALLDELPSDSALARGLTAKEEEFVRHYIAPRGCRIFEPAWGSAADAYRAAFGAAEVVAETHGPALARKPWITAARLLGIRTGREDFPDDMHTCGSEWLRLVHIIDGATSFNWPPSIARALAEAHTILEAFDLMGESPEGQRLMKPKSTINTLPPWQT